MRIKSSLAAGMTALVLVGGAAAPALAAVTYPGGGTWSYGVNGSVYSNYLHPSNRHSASVINGYGEYKSSGCKSAKVWANSSLRADPNRTDKSYYNSSC